MSLTRTVARSAGRAPLAALALMWWLSVAGTAQTGPTSTTVPALAARDQRAANLQPSGSLRGPSERALVGIIRSDNPALRRPLPATEDPDTLQVEDMVRAAVAAAGGLEQVLDRQARMVAIKPNLVEVKRSGDGTVTDWRVVRAVARLVHEIAPQARVNVIEGCNWDVPEDGWSREDGWGYAGYTALAAEGYVELVNLNSDSTATRAVPGGGLARTSYAYPLLMDSVDCFIDVPVIKVIGMVGMTAAMKSLVGMVPMPGRRAALAHTWELLDETIVDLNLLHHVDFVVADALVCLERAKTTSWDGQAVRLNAVLASADVVAADAAAARLIGLNPDDLEYVTLAEQLGMGVADSARIDIRGEDLARVGRRFEKLKTLADRYGQTPKTWVLSGPFPAAGPDEQFLDPEQVRGIPGENGWSEPVQFETDRIDLRKALGRPRNCAAYAFTEFVCPRTEPAELWVGSGEALTVWIDGQPVYRYVGSRRHDVPSDRQRLSLTAGRHRLLVKAYQTYGAFDFSLNICQAEPDPRYEGNRVSGLRFVLPGDRTAPVPRADDKAPAPPFDLDQWLTPRTFALEVERTIDRRHGLPENGLSQIALDRGGRVWVTTQRGVYQQVDDTLWTVHGQDQGVRPGWSRDLLIGPRDGCVWATIEGRLHRFDGKQWEALFTEDWSGSLFLDREGHACVSSFQRGVRCFEDSTWQSYEVLADSLKAANMAECGLFDAQGALWVGTWGHGAWRRQGDTWTRMTVADGLADNHPEVFAAAPNGDLWVGFEGIGISRLHQGRWRTWFGEGAPEAGVQGIVVSGNGTVWVSGNGGDTLSRFDGKEWATATCGEPVSDMLLDDRGRLWLVTGSAVNVCRVE